MAGFIRYKLDNLTEGTHSISVTIGENTYTKQVIIKKLCAGDLYLKYIDKNGFYRFYPFNKYYEKKDTPKLIGKVDNIVNDLLTAQSSSKNVGYTKDRVINAVADLVPESEIVNLSSIYDSPRVYLHDGSVFDNLENWLLVTVKSKDNMIKKSKGNFYRVELEITLPEQNTIKML